MSKGMHNLIAMTHAAQKTYNTGFNLHVGINEKEKSVTLTDDKDCLPCEITRYRLANFLSTNDLTDKVKEIEKLGYSVYVDTDFLFYETKEK